MIDLADETLTEVADGVIVRTMLTIDDAIDFACSGLAAKTRADYSRLLGRFADQFPAHHDVAKVTEADCIRFLTGTRHLAQGTRAWQETVLDGGFFKKLYLARKIKTNPMEFIPRTRRPDPESLDTKTISSGEVAAMFEAAETWAERLCIAVLAYLGPRRGAAATLRLRDFDQPRGRLRFHEKGGKTIWKRIPSELEELLVAALAAGAIQAPPNDYLIPPEADLRRSGDRDDRVIWRLVKRIAERAGVDAHTHSLRAAFADFCLDSDMSDKALQLLMGHKSPETTQRYTRRYDRERVMEPVRNLSWRAVIDGNTPSAKTTLFAGKALAEPLGVGAGGFEPPESEPPDGERAGLLYSEAGLADALQERVSEVAERSPEEVE